MDCLDHLYSRAGFFEEGDSGFLLAEVMEIPSVATSVMYSKITVYGEAKSLTIISDGL